MTTTRGPPKGGFRFKYMNKYHKIYYLGIFSLLAAILIADSFKMAEQKNKDAYTIKKEYLIYVKGFIDGQKQRSNSIEQAMDIMVRNASNKVWEIKMEIVKR